MVAKNGVTRVRLGKMANNMQYVTTIGNQIVTYILEDFQRCFVPKDMHSSRGDILTYLIPKLILSATSVLSAFMWKPNTILLIISKITRDKCAQWIPSAGVGLANIAVLKKIQKILRTVSNVHKA